MLDRDPAFRPIRRLDGYPPLEDLGLIGDGATPALVALDGRIVWMCVPGFGSDPLFCALLDAGNGGEFAVTLPLRGVVGADHPRTVAITAAVAERLSAGNGLLYRYRHDESPDGLVGDEGAFLLCSFWLVDNLLGQGRLDGAEELYVRTGRPDDRRARRQLPQAFSHIDVIASGVTLARARAGGAG